MSAQNSPATHLQHFRTICELKHCQVWQVASGSGKWQVAERAFKWKLPSSAAQFNFSCCGCLLGLFIQFTWPILISPFLSFNQLLRLVVGLQCSVFGI